MKGHTMKGFPYYGPRDAKGFYWTCNAQHDRVQRWLAARKGS